MMTPSANVLAGRKFANVHFLALMVMTLIGFYMCFREIRRLGSEVLYTRAQFSEALMRVNLNATHRPAATGQASSDGRPDEDDIDDEDDEDDEEDDDDLMQDVTEFGLSHLLGMALQHGGADVIHQHQHQHGGPAGFCGGSGSGGSCSATVEELVDGGEKQEEQVQPVQPEPVQQVPVPEQQPEQQEPEQQEPGQPVQEQPVQEQQASAADGPIPDASELAAMDVAGLKQICTRMGVVLKPGCRKSVIVQAIQDALPA